MMKDTVSSSSIITIGDYNQMGLTVLDENRFHIDHVLKMRWVLMVKNLQNSFLSTNQIKKLLNFSVKSWCVPIKITYTFLATSTQIKLLSSTFNSKGVKIGLTAKLMQR